MNIVPINNQNHELVAFFDPEDPETDRKRRLVGPFEGMEVNSYLPHWSRACSLESDWLSEGQAGRSGAGTTFCQRAAMRCISSRSTHRFTEFQSTYLPSTYIVHDTYLVPT